MRSLPKLGAAPEKEGRLAVSLLIPARNVGVSLAETVTEAHRYLSSRYGKDFEIVLIPNPAAGDPQDRSVEAAEALVRRFANVRSVPHLDPPGKGAALRTGVLSAQGRLIFFTDADLPYDLSFFDGAAKKLAQGFDLVTGNRRLPTSHFDVPVSLLPLAYKRHRLGLAFNWMARRLFPLQTTDTQAGIKAMSRRLALRAFSLQACPGFFFDLELFLTARGYGMRATELPVTLFLNSEKSSVRVLKESVLAGVWLARISWRSFRKAYGPGPRPPKILARYPRTRWSTRFFLSVRWKLTPYSQMAHELPERGPILDMGCGHGLFTLALALQSSERQVLGFDHDEDRVGLAREAARDLPNIDVRSGNMTEPPP
ncbi:MAG: glycosyltransferase, partial [Bdellovibrionota bacterium]